MAPILLHGSELWHALSDAQYLVFSNDQVLLVFQFDLRACVFPDEHRITWLDVQRNRLAVVVHATTANGHDPGLLWLLFRGIRDDDSANTLFWLLDSLEEHAIAERS